MKISGIYKIQSTVNSERVYIGSAVNISRRWILHLFDLRHNKHHSPKLQNHFNKYGESDLVFIIVEPCLPEFLIGREQFYIDTLNPFFNIVKTAGSILGYKHSVQTIKKMKENLNSTVFKPGSSGGLGRTHSEKQKQMSRERLLGKKQSKEVIQNRVDQLKKPIIQYDLNMGFIKEWPSTMDVIKENFEWHQNSISMCLTNKSKTSYWFIWRYKPSLIKVT